MHSKNTSYRPDIDGLRAIAVILVLLFHFDLGVPGGFIGVDVFFVISGYLITEVIKNAISSGRFSFGDFYIRRLLRLHPALIATVAMTMLAGFLIMDPASFSSLAASAKYSLLSASNFYFWLNQGYFDAAAQTQPLLHTWSLAAEWQFYLVWPFVVWGALKVSPRFLLCLLALMTAVSLAASETMLRYDSSAAYYMMPFRVFELSIGAMLVFVSGHRAGVKTESAIVVAGLAAIIGSAFALESSSPFPGILALVPCLGAAACIYSGRSRAANILRTRPMVKIGLISYSVYLVHWPIVVFYRYWIFRDISLTEKSSLLLASIAAGFALYHTVERLFMGKGRLVKPLGLAAVSASVVFLAWGSTLVIDHSGMKSRVPAEYLIFAADPASYHTNNYGGVGYDLETKIGDVSGSQIAVIGGDSFALQYASGIDNVLKGTGKYIGGVFQHGCVLSGEYTRVLRNIPREDCRDSYRKILGQLQGNELPFIFAQSWEGYKGMIADSSGRTLDTASDYNYSEIIIDMLSKIRSDIGDRKMVIVGSQPYLSLKNAAVSCLLRPRYIDQACDIYTRYKLESTSAHKLNMAIKDFADTHPNTQYVDASSSLCNDGYCNTASEGKILYSDAAHLSIEGSIIASKQILRDVGLSP